MHPNSKPRTLESAYMQIWFRSCYETQHTANRLQHNAMHHPLGRHEREIEIERMGERTNVESLYGHFHRRSHGR